MVKVIVLYISYEWKAVEYDELFYSLFPGKNGCDFKYVNFKHNLKIDILSTQVNINLESMQEDLADGKFTQIQVITSH